MKTIFYLQKNYLNNYLKDLKMVGIILSDKNNNNNNNNN